MTAPDPEREVMLLPAYMLAVPLSVPKRGHAARPGTGPKGETCGTCAHRVRTDDTARPYQKCGLTRGTWTRGLASDVRAKDPACAMWQALAPTKPRCERCDTWWNWTRPDA